MDKIIEKGILEWDWKRQIIGGGDNPISIPNLIASIESGYYQSEEFMLDLKSLNLDMYDLKSRDLYDFIIHSKLVERANLDYPVILNRKGYILDGRHRIVKAILSGIKEIKAVRILDSDVI